MRLVLRRIGMELGSCKENEELHVWRGMCFWFGVWVWSGHVEVLVVSLIVKSTWMGWESCRMNEMLVVCQVMCS